MRIRVEKIVAWLGRGGIAFVVLLAAYVAMGWFAPRSGFRLVAQGGAAITGVWLAIRLLRRPAEQMVWRLRNRLLVTYLFIAVIPVALILGLAAASAYSLVNQLAVYVVTSELDRRIDALSTMASSVASVVPTLRIAEIARVIGDRIRVDRFPGIEMILRQSGREYRYPANSALPAPPSGWKPTSGVLLREGQYYLWSYTKTPEGDVTVTAPITSEFLAGLAPGLGVVFQGPDVRNMPNGRSLPPARSRFDAGVLWFANVPAAIWDHPGDYSSNFQLGVWARISAVAATIFNRSGDAWQGLLQFALILGLVVFVIVEIASLLIGIPLARTITGAVHHLYEGTQKVMEGDFSHRIEVSGTDQLGELSVSFNRMTENLERLLAVAKEKERLQSEIEIAREVQNQLYPRAVPQMKSLRITAACEPARIVSGDYYDYEVLGGNQIAMAIGDVAGKGISAALLMATLQSSLRTHLNANSDGRPSPAWLVSCLNQHLFATTSQEKYATFWLGIYDEASSAFTYTNAGHVPPILVRNGGVQRLDVNGTIVGAFQSSEYGQSSVSLEADDLLVCFTDGITEPENEYGEMFGEERLMDLISKNFHRSEAEIVQIILAGVRQWTASDELQDDMTLLLARRV